MNDIGVKYGNRYKLSLALIFVGVSFLIHFPELIGLFDQIESHNVFPGIRMGEVLNEVFFSFLSLLFLFWMNTAIFKFNRIAAKIGLGKLLLSFMLCWLVSTALSNLFYYLHTLFNLPAIQATVHHYLHPVRDFILSCVVTSSCYIVYLMRKQQQTQLENQQLRLANILGQYETLKSQLNPHMLFNSLNTLRFLIREAPGKARDYTQELSNVLRYMLQDHASQSVTFSEELEFVEGYMFLLKMRYEDNLTFTLATDKKFNSYRLPPMSLQVLVENAVKHNEISNRHPLTITLRTTEEGTLYVCNPLQPKRTQSTGTGIGLDNLIKRYRLLFNKEIEVYNKEGVFCVCIPLINPQEP